MDRSVICADARWKCGKVGLCLCLSYIDWCAATMSVIRDNTLCPEKKDRQYFGRNFDKFRQLFIIFGKNHRHNPSDYYCKMSCQYMRYTIRHDDVGLIVTSLKKAVFGPVSWKNVPTVIWASLWQIQIYSLQFFARNIVKNAKLLTQQMSASPNQCRYFTLRIRQLPCIAKHKVITDNCN